MRLGDRELGQGNLAAVAYFRKVVALDLLRADAFGKLGFTLKEMGQIEEAGSNLNRAVKINPKSVDALFSG